MSKTIVDMPKVTQMLDAGWCVMLFKNGMGTYTTQALSRKIEETEDGDEWTLHEEFDTDDFTPEQALTRLAYKIHGEII